MKPLSSCFQTLTPELYTAEIQIYSSKVNEKHVLPPCDYVMKDFFYLKDLELAFENEISVVWPQIQYAGCVSGYMSTSPAY